MEVRCGTVLPHFPHFVRTKVRKVRKLQLFGNSYAPMLFASHSQSEGMTKKILLGGSIRACARMTVLLGGSFVGEKTSLSDDNRPQQESSAASPK